MGDTISSLVFRPPRPTPIHPSEYFYLDVDVHSPLCSNKALRRSDDAERCGVDGDPGSCGVTGCLDTGESDLASLDAQYVRSEGYCAVYGGVDSEVASSGDDGTQRPSGTVSNMRDGQIYKVPAFFIRRRNATRTLLFSHGNAEDLGMMYSRMKDLAMVLGVNIMAYDYTGYGLSMPGPAHGSGRSSPLDGDGTNATQEGPSENMIYRNIDAAYRYLTKTRGIPPGHIILYGRSLGSGPSCYLAAKTALEGESVGGLILHSPFLSVYKVVADLNGLDMGAVGDMFHNEKRAKNVRCPTLIIHGRRDEVVPFWHAPRLLAAIPPEFRAQPFFVDEMGHNHIESRCRERYVAVVSNFLKMNSLNDNVDGNTALKALEQRDQTGNRYSPDNTPVFNGPSPVPMDQRADPSETKENASFYVNKTWLRHAKVLLKEVFADAGCYVNTSDYDNCEDGKWEGRSVRSNASSMNRRVQSAGASTGSRGSSSSGSGLVVDRYSKGMSDARDDVDEFAPWRGRVRSLTTSSQPSHSARQQNILRVRPGDSPVENSQLGSGTSAGYRRSTTPRYAKTESMPAVRAKSPPEYRKTVSETSATTDAALGGSPKRAISPIRAVSPSRVRKSLQLGVSKVGGRSSLGGGGVQRRTKGLQILEGTSRRGQF